MDQPEEAAEVLANAQLGGTPPCLEILCYCIHSCAAHKHAKLANTHSSAAGVSFKGSFQQLSHQYFPELHPGSLKGIGERLLPVPLIGSPGILCCVLKMAA